MIKLAISIFVFLYILSCTTQVRHYLEPDPKQQNEEATMNDSSHQLR